MRIRVRDVDLWFDVDGAGLVPDGPAMRAKPTLLLIHGGPGADHTIWKPAMTALRDLAQIVYLDLRGNGRSGDGPDGTWTLDHWADDIAAFCDALGIVKPIVMGASFGGFVTQAYATRHPGHAGALILSNTTAHVVWDQIFDAFDSVGGPGPGATARAYWNAPTPERRQRYFTDCLPLYAVQPMDPNIMARMIVKAPVAMHFNGPDNEMGRFDFRAALPRVTCPVLLVSSDADVMMPPAFSNTIEAALTNAPVTRITLPDCGHMAMNDAPDAMMAALRGFITQNAQQGEDHAA